METGVWISWRATGVGTARTKKAEARASRCGCIMVTGVATGGWRFWEDIFLSQNFFGVDEETTRYDAGRGVWLRGDGRGQFEVVPGHVSGVKVYGEGRGSALGDYDSDGRVDLVVGQNGAETKLYHNVGAKPGLRVRLVGPAGNPTGVGAVVRLRFGERWGPAREVHAGSGYWSQDSAVQVLGTPDSPTALWVRWPGGKTQQVEVPPGANRECRAPAPRYL